MWRGIEGHDALVDHFQRMLTGGRLASTYLFVGAEGVGKRLFARELAACLLCTTDPLRLESCGVCSSCQLFKSGSHPDLIEIGLPPDKASLSINQLIGPKENRHHEGLCHDISLRPFAGSRRVAIIDEADTLNIESANCLLKTLEEPPPRSIMILLSTSESRQLPTIRSRCQIVRFRPLQIDVVERLLAQSAAEWGPDAAGADELRRAALASGGSLARARQLLSPTLWQLASTVLRQLDDQYPNAAAIATAVQQATDSAGTEAALRREFLDSFFQILVDELREKARKAIDEGRSATYVDAIWTIIDASLAAIDAVLRSAHIANVILRWSQQVAEAARRGSESRQTTLAS
jgi:DNA polymerase III subunit delta'